MALAVAAVSPFYSVPPVLFAPRVVASRVFCWCCCGSFFLSVLTPVTNGLAGGVCSATGCFPFKLLERDVRGSSCPYHRRYSTWVIVGPRAQLASMFHPARATAAAAYLGSLIFALFAAFFGGRLRYPLVLISLVVEVLACTFLVVLFCYAFCDPRLFTNEFCTPSLPMLGVIHDTAARTHHPFVPRFSFLLLLIV